MTGAFRLQVASDVIRDGLGLELVGEDETPVAEVFRSDERRKLLFSCFRDEVPFVEIERLVAAARDQLGDFEDGTPLPKPAA